MYGTLLVGGLLFSFVRSRLKPPPLRWAVFFLVPMAVDGGLGLAVEWLHFMPMGMLWSIGLIAMGITSAILHSRRYLTWHSQELIRRQFIGTPGLGWKIAWSDRMVALFTSIFLFGLLYALLGQRGIRFKGISAWLLLFFILPLAVDGTTHLINDVLRLDFRDANQWAVVQGVFLRQISTPAICWVR